VARHGSPTDVSLSGFIIGTVDCQSRLFWMSSRSIEDDRYRHVPMWTLVTEARRRSIGKAKVDPGMSADRRNVRTGKSQSRSHYRELAAWLGRG
jgi:hypothetical protein